MMVAGIMILKSAYHKAPLRAVHYKWHPIAVTLQGRNYKKARAHYFKAQPCLRMKLRAT